MGKEFSMRDIMNLPLEKEDDELELSLELSIGGNYGKPEIIVETRRDSFGENGFNDSGISRSYVSSNKNDVGAEIGGGFLDLTNKREIQALRRQKARKKREEKFLKSRIVNAGGFLEDKLFLETQKFQSRVHDREIRENDRVLARKSEKFIMNEVGKNLSLSLFKEDKKLQAKCWFSNGNGIAYMNECGSRNLSMNCDSGLGNGKIDQGNRASMSNISTERSSSAISDYQGKFQKGGSTSDAGSHSSGLSSKTTDAVEQFKGNDSSSPAEPQLLLKVGKLKYPPESKETSNNVKQLPPRPSSQNQVAAPRMPCVSTTGNGPNGRTITGFLYKYTKSEVSIMCVCHGVSFSPAEFVEHAGCVDIENPLRHITVVPSL